MSDDRPLDALFPELAEARSPFEITPVHQRVLEVDLDDQGWEWLLCVWRDPGGPRALHNALRPLVEATLLATLSQAPATGAETLGRDWRSLRLVVFEPVADLAVATRAFGMSEVPWDDAIYPGRMGALTDEARTMGWPIADRPHAVLEAEIAGPDGAHGEHLAQIQEAMADKMGDDVWGDTPGGPSRLLALLLEQHFGARATIEPTLEGLRTLELLVTHRRPGVIRWIPPLVYQALCDFIAIVAHTELDAELQWAVCEADPHGLFPPPHVRWTNPSGQSEPVYVPIGTHVLRWCVMPIAEGEEIPSLAEWLVDQFGPG